MPNRWWYSFYVSNFLSSLPSDTIARVRSKTFGEYKDYPIAALPDWNQLFTENFQPSEDNNDNIDNNNVMEKEKGLVKIYSVRIYPSYIIRMRPTLEKSNRVLRKFSGFTDRFLRVSFLGSSGTKYINIINDEEQSNLQHSMKVGLRIAGRRYEYLLYTNSQLTKSKSWFFSPFYSKNASRILDDRFPKDLSLFDSNYIFSPIPNWINSHAIIKWMGDFENIKIDKMGKYIALSFSSSSAICNLNDDEWEMIDDIPVNPNNENEDDSNIKGNFPFFLHIGQTWEREVSQMLFGKYNNREEIYSDGVGFMSKELMDLVCHKLSIPSTSAIQIRFAGYKGVLTLNPSLFSKKIQLRKSMLKFECPHNILEVIDYSKFIPITLNEKVFCLLLCLYLPIDIIKKRITSFLSSFPQHDSSCYHEDEDFDELAKALKLSLEINNVILENKDNNNNNDNDNDNINDNNNDKKLEDEEISFKDFVRIFEKNLKLHLNEKEFLDNNQNIIEQEDYLYNFFNNNESLFWIVVFYILANFNRRKKNSKDDNNNNVIHEINFNNLINKESLFGKYTRIEGGNLKLIDHIYNDIRKKYLVKNKFRLPINEGGQFIGVLDYTGSLKANQMFLQIDRMNNNENKEVIQGRAIVYRDPHPIPNDVRTVELIDVPELHHLVNCAVFPADGFFPLHLQCSGGDLDGDKYYVIWDPDFTQVKSFPSLFFFPLKLIIC